MDKIFQWIVMLLAKLLTGSKERQRNAKDDAGRHAPPNPKFSPPPPPAPKPDTYAKNNVPPSSVKQVFHSSIEEEFEKHVRSFTGLYNALWLAAHDPSFENDKQKRVLHDWEQRIQRSGSRELIHAWERLLVESTGQSRFSVNDHLTRTDLEQIARKWLANLLDWGVIINQEDEIVLTEQNEGDYLIISPTYDLGDKITIIHPRWTIKNTLVERGSGVVKTEEV